ncbi:DUF3253 domain-containing protein [Paraburkholderia sp. PREW-6R]|uniref:DUF3253 domain-containing protein n=1 Tax=Paraburkholderia sp. PREW-6R TaxID=3141544 RepID=UPI0031F4CC00
MNHDERDIEQKLLALLSARRAQASICPSDVARALSSDEACWRALMPAVRTVAARLARAHVIRITQGDAAVPPAQIDHGPIRLRRGPAFERGGAGGAPEPGDE